MVGARSAAMALNRLIDAGDSTRRNPRTATRELPAGRLGRREVWLFAIGVRRTARAWRRSNSVEPCRYLWPIPLAAFVLYPYAKRFTWACHYALGLTLGLAPAAAWLAVTRHAAVLSPWLLFFAVGLWVGGFDVIYAIFDLDFDRRPRPALGACVGGRARALSSWPRSRTSPPSPSWWPWARCRDLGLRLLGSDWLRSTALARLAAHRHRAPRDRHGVGMSFMTVNGAVGLLLRRRSSSWPLCGRDASTSSERGESLSDTPCGTMLPAGASSIPPSRSQWAPRSPSLGTLRGTRR